MLSICAFHPLAGIQMFCYFVSRNVFCCNFFGHKSGSFYLVSLMQNEANLRLTLDRSVLRILWTNNTIFPSRSCYLRHGTTLIREKIYGLWFNPPRFGIYENNNPCSIILKIIYFYKKIPAYLSWNSIASNDTTCIRMSFTTTPIPYSIYNCCTVWTFRYMNIHAIKLNMHQKNKREERESLEFGCCKPI